MAEMSEENIVAVESISSQHNEKNGEGDKRPKRKYDAIFLSFGFTCVGNKHAPDAQ